MSRHTKFDVHRLPLAAASLAATLGAGTVQAAIRQVPAAYATIQDAVDASVDGDRIVIADGVYTESVEIFGKSISLNSQSGDPALCIIEGNSFGVHLFNAVTQENVTLRGLTIRDCTTGAVVVETLCRAKIENCIIEDNASSGGVHMNAVSLEMVDCIVRNNAASSNGAGLNIVGGDVTLRNTLFRRNDATGSNPYGGACYVGGDALVRIVDCSFEENSAIGLGAGNGGALGVQGGSTEPIEIVNTTFEDNNANTGGGAFYIEHRDAVLGNVVLRRNTALSGGGIFFDDTGGTPHEVVVANALFVRNEATNGEGGGIYHSEDSSLTVTNATVVRNTSTQGGGGVHGEANSTAKLTSCIVTDSAPADLGGQGTRDVTYSNVEDGHDGKGNISELPQFMNINNGNYRLSEDSPCIDAGDTAGYRGPALDLAGKQRAVDDPDVANTGFALADGSIDMGAYEYQPIDVPCLADLDGDGSTGFNDLTLLLGHWGPCT